MRSMCTISKWWWGVLSIIVFQMGMFAQSGINSIGGFEQSLPSYWNIASAPSGATLTWATDEYRSMGKSLKIEKSATSDSAMWESENMCDLWSEKTFKDVDINLGMYYMTSGVNTNPANDDEKWYVTYTFYDSVDAVIGVKKFELDQSVASTGGWVADTTDIGEISLPENSWKTIIRFVGGKDATGTVWTDNYILVGRNGGWAGQDWNTQLGVPTGWYYWMPPIGGNDGVLNAGFENTKITDEESYNGNYSLKYDLPLGRPVKDGFIATRKFEFDDAQPGDVLRISIWVKGMNLYPDSAQAVGDQWHIALSATYHSTIGNNEGFNQYGNSDQIPLQFPDATSFDWTQFYVDVTVPEPPEGQIAKAISIRLHALTRFAGTVWMDDLKVEKLDLPGINDIGSFEQSLPSYWTKGSEPNGSTLTWATDESLSMGKSLKIEKSATSDSAMWESENMCDLWSEKTFKDVDINLGMYYMTSGVNTNPANDDEKWYVTYTFYDSVDAVIGVKKFELDQSVASTGGWVADTTDIGEISLPENSWKTIIRFVGGKDATGTVWTDNYILVGRNGGWAGQDWNTQLGVPTGWYYWMPPIGGNDGVLNAGFENTKITDEESYNGNYSLKYDLPLGRPVKDGFIATRKFELTDVVPGDNLKLSIWVKGMNLYPDSAIAVGDQWHIALSATYHSTIGNNEGFNQYGNSDQIPLEFPYATSFDWTQFYVNVTVPEPPEGQIAKAISIRLHALTRFAGTVYLDGLEVIKTPTRIENNEFLPVSHKLFQNYPNPFNPSTTISYSIPNTSFVTLKIYDILGREVKTLISSEQNSGLYNIQWNGDNNYGSKVSSGIYLYRIEAGDFIVTKKMLLLK